MSFKTFTSGFLYGFVSMILAPLLINFLNNSLRLPDYTNLGIKVTGILLVTTGFIVLVYCTKLFSKKGKGSPWPFDPPSKLVTTGIYRYSRNPQFVASAFIWFGEFLLFGSLLLLFYAVAWVLFNHIQLVLFDEKMLEKRFGKEYLIYKTKVRRYL